MTEHREESGAEDIRRKIAFAISDPGHAGEGYKLERTLTEWQTDAVMRVVDAAIIAERERYEDERGIAYAKVAWSYCPECGSDEFEKFGQVECICNRCGQEWHTDIDYSISVKGNLGDWHSLKSRSAAPTPQPESDR